MRKFPFYDLTTSICVTIMHWVYVLQSSQTGSIYVGETTRLFRRWREHWSGRGGKITSQDDYDTIIGLYSVGANYSFLAHRENILNGFGTFNCEKTWGLDETKQTALLIENHITERYMIDRGVIKLDIMGGKYLTDNICENFCFGSQCKEYVRDRPTCFCSYPCEVKLTKAGDKIYFCCPVPDWVDDAPEKCKFYQEFEPYKKVREANILAFENRTKRLTAFDVFTKEV